MIPSSTGFVKLYHKKALKFLVHRLFSRPGIDIKKRRRNASPQGQTSPLTGTFPVFQRTVIFRVCFPDAVPKSKTPPIQQCWWRDPRYAQDTWQSSGNPAPAGRSPDSWRTRSISSSFDPVKQLIHLIIGGNDFLCQLQIPLYIGSYTARHHSGGSPGHNSNIGQFRNYITIGNIEYDFRNIRRLISNSLHIRNHF